jgi:hypothetical protein
MDPLNKNNHSLNDHIENLIINVQPGTSTITETKEIEFNPFDGCVILFLNIIFFSVP